MPGFVLVDAAVHRWPAGSDVDHQSMSVQTLSELTEYAREIKLET